MIVCYLYVWGRGGEEVLYGQALAKTRAQGKEQSNHSHPDFLAKVKPW